MATAGDPLEGIQQDKDGNYFDVVDLGDGSGPQVYKGRTVGEVLAQYRRAQANATRKIREQALQLKLRDTPDPAIPELRNTQHAPNADELWQLSEDLRDPAKALAALRRATEWQLGTSLEEVRATVVELRNERMRNQIFAAGEAFMEAHPEYKRCPENEEAMFSYLEKHNYGFTRKNFEIAFEELKPGLVLNAPKQIPVVGTEQADGRIDNSVVTRPRTATTGLSPRGSSAVPPTGTPAQRSARLTEADIDAMPTAEFQRRVTSDPAFAREAENVLQAAANARNRR